MYIHMKNFMSTYQTSPQADTWRHCWDISDFHPTHMHGWTPVKNDCRWRHLSLVCDKAILDLWSCKISGRSVKPLPRYVHGCIAGKRDCRWRHLSRVWESCPWCTSLQNFRSIHETTAEIYVIFTQDICTDGRQSKTIVGGATCLWYVIKPSKSYIHAKFQPDRSNGSRDMWVYVWKQTHRRTPDTEERSEVNAKRLGTSSHVTR